MTKKADVQLLALRDQAWTAARNLEAAISLAAHQPSTASPDLVQFMASLIAGNLAAARAMGEDGGYDATDDQRHDQRPG